jgi:hydroxymethylglutaryl-CoA lyase
MESVKLIECPRDAWQGLPGQIPTQRKVEYLRELVAAGFRHIDAVSFVSPKAVPQMADSEDVLKEFGKAGGTEIIGIVVNERGASRAIATGAVSTLGYPCSISETFLRRNQNQSIHENLEVLKKIKGMADECGLGMVVYISMAFGNPYSDAWSKEKVVEAARIISTLGVTAISLADTVGAAQTDQLSGVLRAVIESCADCEIGIHMHSTPSSASGKILAAYQAGCRRFDSAIGGLGGCPFAQDALVGNIPTEEVVRTLKEIDSSLTGMGELGQVSAMNRVIAKEFSRSGAG